MRNIKFLLNVKQSSMQLVGNKRKTFSVCRQYVKAFWEVEKICIERSLERHEAGNWEEAGERKIVVAGYPIPALVMAFCGICDVRMKEENMELLRLLEVPGAVDYVIDGLCQELEQRTISF